MPSIAFSLDEQKLLKQFAELSDQLFNLGVITTDSFTGEIGEYYACQLLNLSKTARVTRAVDAISASGKRYQVKAKVVVNDKFNYIISGLETDLFDFLIVVYLNTDYQPVSILQIQAGIIANGKISITLSNYGSFKKTAIDPKKLQPKVTLAIKRFAKAYKALEEKKIIRSRRVVGDIGEYYAAKRLKLTLSENKNAKGLDAYHPNGLTFEIKTRRVYESGRRVSETRRINGLTGKSADYLIVVTLDRLFECSGMWLVPMKNIVNPKSAKLELVNTTPGVENLVPSKISWLVNGPTFKGFKQKSKLYYTVKKPKRKVSEAAIQKGIQLKKDRELALREKYKQEEREIFKSDF